MSIRKTIKTLLIEPLVEPYGIFLMFVAFLIGVLYAGGDLIPAAIDVGIWLTVFYIAAFALNKLL